MTTQEQQPMTSKTAKERMGQLYLPRRADVEAPVVKFPGSGVPVKNPVVFSGTGKPGWSVIVYVVPIDGETLLATRVDEDGSWSAESEVSLSAGKHSAFALQVYNSEISPWSRIFDYTVVTQ